MPGQQGGASVSPEAAVLGTISTPTYAPLQPALCGAPCHAMLTARPSCQLTSRRHDLQTAAAVHLTAAEQALYRKVHSLAASRWQALRALGPNFVNSHLFSITSMLMPLRRICSGGQLEEKDVTVPDPAARRAHDGGCMRDRGPH